MRIGINSVPTHSSPEEWADILVKEGFRATCFPVSYTASDREIEAYRAAAASRDILIAEVGVWDSPHQRDPKKAAFAKEKAYHCLELADHVGARCCVNVSGATGDHWAYLDKGNFGPEIYAKNVEFIQTMLDTVKPTKTYFALEPMQWMVPDSPEVYEQMLRDVNRDRFAVHMDFINFIRDPYLYTHQEELVDRCFAKLGPMIRSCHIKDCIQEDCYTVAIHEVPLGQGQVNFPYYLKAIEKLDADMPVLLEHLPDFENYCRARAVLTRKGY